MYTSSMSVLSYHMKYNYTRLLIDLLFSGFSGFCSSCNGSTGFRFKFFIGVSVYELK